MYAFRQKIVNRVAMAMEPAPGKKPAKPELKSYQTLVFDQFVKAMRGGSKEVKSKDSALGGSAQGAAVTDPKILAKLVKLKLKDEVAHVQGRKTPSGAPKLVDGSEKFLPGPRARPPPKKKPTNEFAVVTLDDINTLMRWESTTRTAFFLVHRY